MHEGSGVCKPQISGLAKDFCKAAGDGKRGKMTQGLTISEMRQRLFVRLDELGIAHKTQEHPAFFTVEDGRAYKASMPGGHSKNLFVKDKKGAMTLAVAHADTQVDLVALGKAVGAKGRWSFGKPELMVETLGVSPGAVTPFALIHDGSSALTRVLVDKALISNDLVWFHPLENTASTAVSPDGLLAFIRSCGFEPEIFDFAAPIKG